MYKIPVYKPSLTGNEKKYVNECLESTWISSKGKFISEFEDKFSDFIGTEYGAAVCNGTVAIHLALVALGVGVGDEVIVPTFTYIASANPILQVGADPVFVDIERNTWQMSADDIRRKITSKTKVIMVVHLYGHPCDMDSIMKIAEEYSLFVIEDCAESIGSEYKGKKVGTFGDVACFSFFGNKTITCGEGGMVLTDDATIYDRLVHFKGQGLAMYREYWHDTMGFNYRMTNVCAAIGVAQLEQINSFIKRKRIIAEEYMNGLQDLPLIFHKETENVIHTYWMCSVLVEKPQLRDPLRDFLKESGIETRPTFYPIHTMPLYSQKYQKHAVSEDVALRGINLPSYPELSHADIKFICNRIREFYE